MRRDGPSTGAVSPTALDRPRPHRAQPRVPLLRQLQGVLRPRRTPGYGRDRCAVPRRSQAPAPTHRRRQPLDAEPAPSARRGWTPAGRGCGPRRWGPLISGAVPVEPAPEDGVAGSWAKVEAGSARGMGGMGMPRTSHEGCTGVSVHGDLSLTFPAAQPEGERRGPTACSSWAVEPNGLMPTPASRRPRSQAPPPSAPRRRSGCSGR